MNYASAESGIIFSNNINVFNASKLVNFLLVKLLFFFVLDFLGFQSVNSACCGAGRFRRLADCLAREMACKEHESYIWWDLGNPTEAVNVLLAD